MIHVVWFKRDLRVHDHAPLAAAAASGGPVLPLYIVEPQLWAQPELSGRQFAFLMESLADLQAALKVRGLGLCVRVGEAVQVLHNLHARHTIAALHAHEETGLLWTYARDKAVRRWARQADVPFREVRQHGVIRSLTDRNGWAARWERQMRAPVMAAPAAIRAADVAGGDWPDAPALGLADDPCRERQPGGRRAGAGLLKSFLADRGRFYRKAMSSPSEGAEACSRLSAHLAFGTLSIRETYQAALKAQSRWRSQGDTDFAQSLSSFASRLHWHCHFIQKLEDEPEIETRVLHPATAGLRSVTDAHAETTAAWAEGRTGFPFVDACMRSLRATGWLNFRMRAMVMAFSSYHLWQDWRAPAQALARLFTDFEPGIHYPQVQMQSGTTGTNIARIYNPLKQSTDQDPDGAFIRRWVPELSSLPDALLHAPWTAPPEFLASHGIELGRTYPVRLVDHEVAARQARASIYGVRTGQAFREAASAILQKLGSRKAGLPATERRARPKPPSGQTELDL
jgi:deoxyribodipyrimidine photo-lyase